MRLVLNRYFSFLFIASGVVRESVIRKCIGRFISSTFQRLLCRFPNRVYINFYSIVVFNINFPSLKLLIANHITDKLLRILIIELIPLIEIDYKRFFNFLLLKSIKKPSILWKVKIHLWIINPLTNCNILMILLIKAFTI